GVVNRADAVGRRAGSGNWGGFVLGMTLGVVWTPCAGPVLGSILTLVATSSELAKSALLLFVYALGAGVPMLAIAYGGQYVTTRVRR
ncbi:cytochrome c biogenesis CcdA family protein, partial [Staphylococcus aureus]